MENENVHKGHRDRLRKRFLAEGIDHFTECEVLELLLQFPIPRVDTKPQARRLLERFGTISGVMDASVSNLQTVEGIGEVTASFLHAMPAFYRQYMLAKESSRFRVLRDCIDACEFAKVMYIGRTTEEVGMIGLDSKRAVKFHGILFEGDRNQVHLYPRYICNAALDCNANSVILTHNHPNGSMAFSANDKLLTERVIAALRAFDIELIDHILVVGDSAAVSMEDIGQLQSIRDKGNWQKR